MEPARPFSSAGATLMVERRGSGDPAFLLVHGIGMGRSVFGDLIDRLGEEAPVISVDLPGYGDAPEPRRVLTMQRTADLLAALLHAEADSPVIAIGHSMGAQVVLELAARHPSLVAGIVLVGPSGDPAARNAVHQLGRIARDIIGEHPKVIVLGGKEYLRAGPQLRTKMRAMLAHRPEDMLHEITAPTLVIRGEDDFVAPRRWCRMIADAIPGARLAEVPDRRHETMIRDAEPAADLIREFARTLI